MKNFTQKKLIRDKILDEMKVSDQEPLGVRTLADEEFVKELLKKLIEETNEMLSTNDPSEMKKELCDIVEITNYIKETLQLSDEEFNKLLLAKRTKSGGFDKRIYVESVLTKENSNWTKYFLANPERFPEIK